MKQHNQTCLCEYHEETRFVLSEIHLLVWIYIFLTAVIFNNGNERNKNMSNRERATSIEMAHVIVKVFEIMKYQLKHVSKPNIIANASPTKWKRPTKYNQQIESK